MISRRSRRTETSWTPGYWAWDDGAGDYYWTAGTWVQPPEVGLLWTPGYWIFVDARFVFHRGHWGRRIGFYGGIDYGLGFGGQGYQGGRWQGDRFYYNTAANDIADASMSNVYRQAVIERGAPGRASYNGGEGGVSARATAAELAAAQDPRTPPTLLQEQQARMAQSNPAFAPASIMAFRPSPPPPARRCSRVRARQRAPERQG